MTEQAFPISNAAMAAIVGLFLVGIVGALLRLLQKPDELLTQTDRAFGYLFLGKHFRRLHAWVRQRGWTLGPTGRNVLFAAAAALALALVLALSGGKAAARAGDAPQTALAKLARTSEVSCQPSLRVFCSNIHVSCAGPSSLKTFPFKLRATRARGSIASASDTDGIAEQYENGRVEWDDKEDYVILRPRQANGYIKMLADGTYSFRHYSQYAATMSRGQCK